MRRLFLGLIVLLVSTLPCLVQAKDLRNRLGAGMDTQMGLMGSGSKSPVLPANLSVKYTLPASDKTINIQFELLLGIDLPENDSASVVGGGRFLYTVVAEDNCNVFLGVGTAYLRSPDLPNASGLFRIQPLSGVEFFFYGLENLGFTTSVGINVDLGNPLGVSVVGATFGAVGVHYYF